LHETLFCWPESLEGTLRANKANKRLEESIMTQSQNQNPNQKPGQQQQGGDQKPGQQGGQQGQNR
jgi:ABC-type uncharacterized transport system YnjBCD ATPase subunit